MLTNFFFCMKRKTINLLVALRLAEHVPALPVTGSIITTSDCNTAIYCDHLACKQICRNVTALIYTPVLRVAFEVDHIHNHIPLPWLFFPLQPTPIRPHHSTVVHTPFPAAPSSSAPVTLGTPFSTTPPTRPQFCEYTYTPASWIPWKKGEEQIYNICSLPVAYEDQVVAFFRLPDVVERISQRYRRGVRPQLRWVGTELCLFLFLGSLVLPFYCTREVYWICGYTLCKMVHFWQSPLLFLLILLEGCCLLLVTIAMVLVGMGVTILCYRPL